MLIDPPVQSIPATIPIDRFVGDRFSDVETVTPHYYAMEPGSAAPSIVPSIAKTAGIGRFIYLVGYSQQRYVFSSINRRQISLYYDAVFAVVSEDCPEDIWVGDYSRLIEFTNDNQFRPNSNIFVHLLTEDATAKAFLIEDFSRY